jgi:hypothetical protein
MIHDPDRPEIVAGPEQRPGLPLDVPDIDDRLVEDKLPGNGQDEGTGQGEPGPTRLRAWEHKAITEPAL